MAGGGKGVSIRLRGGRREAHPALLSCRRGWCPPGDKGVAAIPGCEAPSLRLGRGLQVPVGSLVVPCPHRDDPHRPAGAEDLPGAASRRAAAMPETGQPPGPRLRWLRPGRPWRPQGARTRGPRWQCQRSVRRARSSTAAHRRSAGAATRGRSPRPPPPPWGLEKGPGEHPPGLGSHSLHHSLRRPSLGLGCRRHRPHAPQLPWGGFLQEPAGPAPGLECCASAARHMETGAAGTNPSLGSRPSPAPLPRPRLTW